MVNNNEVKKTSIAVSQKTKDALDLIKHPGQSYDGLIQELVKFLKEEGGKYWARRKRQKTPVAVG